MDVREALTPKLSRIEIKHPGSGRGTGLFLDLVSVSDPRVLAADRKYLDSVRSESDGTGTPARHDDQVRARVKARAAIVGCEFTGDANWGGEKPEFSEKLAGELIENVKVYEQVIIHLASDANFFPA